MKKIQLKAKQSNKNVLYWIKSKKVQKRKHPQLDKEKNISKRDVPLWTKSKYPKQKHPPLDIIFLLDISL